MHADALEGLYYDGRSSRSHAVRVVREAGLLCVGGADVALRIPLDQCRLAPRLGGAARKLHLPDGASIELADSPRLDALLGAAPGRWLDRLESRWSLVAGALTAIAVICLAGYLWALPWGADVASRFVPESWQQALADSTLDTLDKAGFAASRLPPARQQQITRAFADWQQGTAHPPYRLLFRRNAMLGANAFALPGGNIVLLDGLVEDARGDEEILGVLAHELGHVAHRHVLRQLIQSSTIAVAAGIWFGDVSALATATSTLVSLRYSRGFEQEADTYAATLMLANGADPRRLGAFLQRLENADATAPDATDAGALAETYLSSHPLTRERMDYLARRAREAGLPPNP
ncbi:MAG: M48 family metallopeptidase [Candidatus Dactylopiibacterium sp.]|nr:M48 family metallopeptidase [Candidatus Dactylopiibacterium sp.]